MRNGGGPTNGLIVFTDRAGNLVTAYPNQGGSTMSVNQAQASLVRTIQELGGSSNRRDFVEGVQRWTRLNLRRWSGDCVSRWGLRELSELNLDELPVDLAELDPGEELERLLQVEFRKMDNLAMRVHQLLWDGVTVRLPVVCRTCCASTMRVLSAPERTEGVLSCDICGRCETPRRELVECESRLVPADRRVACSVARALGLDLA